MSFKNEDSRVVTNKVSSYKHDVKLFFGLIIMTVDKVDQVAYMPWS